MKKIDTVVFDFDGTIADTNKLILDSWQAVYRAYTGADGDEAYILSTFGEPLKFSMEKSVPDHAPEESIAIYRNYQEQVFTDEIRIFPGMKELMKELKEKGYKVGIATSRLRVSTLRGLETLGIKDYVDALVTVDDTDKHKPDPEPALICLRKLGSSPETSIMVGDSAFDMGCGNGAGMTTVMVGWSAAAVPGVKSVATKGTLDENLFMADYLIDTADDLWRVIESIG